jgi:hypothetical protein
MKKNQIWSTSMLALAFAMTAVSCKKNEGNTTPPLPQEDRWITVAGALMQTEPGDGNGGTRVFSLPIREARNPNYSVNVFDDGFIVKSNRTARLQASEDGKFLYNIQYTGADGGVFNKYKVEGGKNFPEADVQINTANYVGTSPRWAKLYDGDKSGIAVNVTGITNVNDSQGTFLYARGIATVLALDLENVSIKGFKDFEIPLPAEEEKEGHHIFRLDAPFLNKAGDKLFVGTWMRKYIPGTTNTDASSKVNTRTLVLDYPSMTNPTLISSPLTQGDNSGYRSPMSYVSSDGSIYQATHRQLSGGSVFLKIGLDNQYDPNYALRLDDALGVQDSYIETWKYAGNGIGYVLYRHGGEETGYVARVDFKNKTAKKIDIPSVGVDYGQYQSLTVIGDEVFIAVTPMGEDGNIYIINKNNEQITKGAKLINKLGNRYIGIY